VKPLLVNHVFKVDIVFCTSDMYKLLIDKNGTETILRNSRQVVNVCVLVSSWYIDVLFNF